MVYQSYLRYSMGSVVGSVIVDVMTMTVTMVTMQFSVGGVTQRFQMMLPQCRHLVSILQEAICPHHWLGLGTMLSCVASKHLGAKES